MNKHVLRAILIPSLLAAVAASAGDYATDVQTVQQSEAQAVEQAKQLLGRAENPTAKEALQKAIQRMERAQSMLAGAETSPDKLRAAVSESEAAYQDLLKIVPHDFSVSQSKGRGRGRGRAGQASQGEIDQLDLGKEDNRYETERQATAAQTPQQKEQLQIADRLKQLAQRQQDLNDRLKELQTALAEARTDQEREDIQRQLKRLSEEERQMLADVDELRQNMDQSPNAASLANARQQLDRTRSDTQKASQELQDQSVSQALAAGSRAQQGMQELRENLRSQASNQFARQMRQMRTEARDLASEEEKIGGALESLANPERKSLDDTAQRKQLNGQLNQQKSALTNLLGQMQAVSEQAETSEPLLSEQLYDTLRQASQMRNENLIETGQQLIDHDLMTQAGEAEQAVRKNFSQLRDKVERAAQSVLGNEADSIRYAQKELDDLSAQVEREAAGATNAAQGGGGTNLAARTPSSSGDQQASSQSSTRSGSQGGAAQGQEGAGTNSAAPNPAGDGESQASNQNSGRRGSEPGSCPAQSDQANSTTGNQNQQGNGSQQASNRGPGDESAERNGASSEGADGGNDRLRQAARQFGGATTAAGGARGGGGLNGPITGNQYIDWADRMRQVEEVVDSPELRNRLAQARERVGVFRSDFRQRHQKPDPNAVRDQVVAPLAEVRARLQEDLSRLSNAKSLVPLDHDPVPEVYSEMVRKYYEKLGGGQ